MMFVRNLFPYLKLRDWNLILYEGQVCELMSKAVMDIKMDNLSWDSW